MARGLCFDCGCVGTGRIVAGGPGDKSVYVSSQDLELVEVRKILEFAKIRRRLQDAEVERVKLRQSAPKSHPEPLVLRSGERWLVLEMPPEVDLSSRPRMPEFMET